jgi:integrase
MNRRTRNCGVRKVCNCGRSRWPKCPHAWYFSYKPRGGHRWRFSLDAELGRHFENLTEAQDAATTIRAAILAGTFRRATDAPPASSTTGITLDQFAAVYIERASKASGKRTWKDDEHQLCNLRTHRAADGRRLGDVSLSSITEDELETFFASLGSFAASTRNQYVQLLKASFRWAAKKGYISRSPISEDSALKRSKTAQRRRRLAPDEEKALLDAAGVSTGGASTRLQWLIIAAIETGCRVGELLALQWADVDLSKRTVYVRAVEEGAKKTGRSRLLPMSARLAAVFEMAKTDPGGRRYPPPAYVFGNLGARVHSVKKAWETALLRAHGHKPEWKGSTLSQASRAQLEAIDLHFHDLRHEAGCRWLEAGWPIHHVQEMLGHTNLSQTSTYLHAAEMGLQESMRRFDAARVDGPSGDFRGKTVAKQQQTEQLALCHDEANEDGKGLLH